LNQVILKRAFEWSVNHGGFDLIQIRDHLATRLGFKDNGAFQVFLCEGQISGGLDTVFDQGIVHQRYLSFEVVALQAVLELDENV
jgi:hypothetical protein